RRTVHLAVDLLREAARLGCEGDAAADEDRRLVGAVARTAALLLLELLGGSVDLGARLLCLGAGAARIAVRDHDLVHEVTLELPAKHVVRNRQRLAATYDGEFHH